MIVTPEPTCGTGGDLLFLVHDAPTERAAVVAVTRWLGERGAGGFVVTALGQPPGLDGALRLIAERPPRQDSNLRPEA